MSEQIRMTRDPVPAIERASAVAVDLYDQVSKLDDDRLRVTALNLLAHLRAARKMAE